MVGIDARGIGGSNAKNMFQSWRKSSTFVIASFIFPKIGIELARSQRQFNQMANRRQIRNPTSDV
jgi:hypothetical protein